MSVVVRMEMPKGCWNCPCVNGEYGYCQADKDERQIEDPNERPSWCPILCQLPEGHGRLVDADEFQREMYHEAFETDTDMQKWDSGCWIRYKMFENTIKNVSTIVPPKEE